MSFISPPLTLFGFDVEVICRGWRFKRSALAGLVPPLTGWGFVALGHAPSAIDYIGVHVGVPSPIVTTIIPQNQGNVKDYFPRFSLIGLFD
jgi:hypothetical protein